MIRTTTITSPWTVEIDGKTLSTRAIVIAAGARPVLNTRQRQ